MGLCIHHPRRSAAWMVLMSACASISASAVAQDAPTPGASRNAGSLQLSGGAAPTADSTARVTRYEVLGNTLVTADELQVLLTPLTGERTLASLKDAAAVVQQHYRDVGYGGVVAFLPEQSLSSGTVRIQVVEGRLEGTQIRGNQHFRAPQMLAALSALVPGQTPRLRAIDTQIQLLNENPARQVRVLLQPGASVGGVAAVIDVREGPVQRFSARLDNTGSARTGRWRTALGWQHADLWAHEHMASAEVQTAPENPRGVAVVSGNYRVPLYAHAALLDVYAAWSDVDGGRSASAVGDVSFSGQGHIAGARLTHFLPRLGEVDQRLGIGLEHRAYLNNCNIAGLPDGACGAAGASVSVQPLSLTYLAQRANGEGTRWSLHASLHHNLSLGGAHTSASDFAAVRAGASRRYTVLRAQGQATAAIAAQWTASARASFQAGEQALVPGEQFGLGGAQGVRGFDERELLGDQGAQLTLELGSPGLWAGTSATGPVDLRALAFADAGWVSNHGSLTCLNGQTSCRAGSAGLGLRLAWRSLQARLDVARAFSTGTSTAKGDVRAHAGLSFFF